MNTFHTELLKKIASSLDNHFYDNFDFEIRKLSKKQKLKIFIEKYLNAIIRVLGKKTPINFLELNNFWKNLNNYEYFYTLLHDEKSKQKYIEIIAYKMLGFIKVKLSLNNEEFWKMRSSTIHFKRSQQIPVNFRNGMLDLYELKDLGFDLKLYFVSNGIVTDFMLQQYNYNDIVKVEKNDIVIDCGGCWGDTALYFASMGAKKVYTYEFIPSNLEVFKKNLALNPHLDHQIEIIPYPVWSESKIKLSYNDKGPASLVDDYERFSDKTETLSIDDLVNQENLETVNFIKMDIEGAEIPALQGAKETIKRFKPKLAISAYHKQDDLINIPELIKSIRSDYTFYFDYYTIIGDEAIIYAI